MQLSNTKPSLAVEQSSPSIKGWAKTLLAENPILVEKIVANTQISSRTEVVAGFEETLKFLFLCARCNKTLTPSILIDQIWHEFILFTRTYESFCQSRLDRFIHHQPSNDDNENKNQYEATLLAYQEIFGEPVQPYWPLFTNIMSDCGSCED